MVAYALGYRNEGESSHTHNTAKFKRVTFTYGENCYSAVNGSTVAKIGADL